MRQHLMQWLIRGASLVLLTSTGPAPAAAEMAAAGIVVEEHRVAARSAADGQSITLYLREKRAAESSGHGSAERRVVLLAHGASVPGSLLFDVQVDARPTYSLMGHLAGSGFDVFALDYQNYGRSDRHGCGRCVTTAAAAEDVDAAVEYIRRMRDVRRVHLLGHSRGAEWSGCTPAGTPIRSRASCFPRRGSRPT